MLNTYCSHGFLDGPVWVGLTPSLQVLGNILVVCAWCTLAGRAWREQRELSVARQRGLRSEEYPPLGLVLAERVADLVCVSRGGKRVSTGRRE